MDQEGIFCSERRLFRGGSKPRRGHGSSEAIAPLIFGRLIVSQTFFVAKEAQSRPEREGDVSGQLVTQLRKKPLRRRVSRVGIDAQYVDAALGCDLLRLLHQR